MDKDQKLAAECLCPMCPSYVKCDEPLAYCIPPLHVSQCIKWESGCACPVCPVADQLKLDREYYCLR